MSHEDEKKEQPNMDDQQSAKDSSRRSLLKRGVLWGGVSALAGAFGLSPLTADAATQSNSSTTIVELNGPEAQQYINVTLASNQYKSFQTQQSSLLQGFTLNESETKAQLITTTTEKVVFVRVPIVGGAGNSFYAEAIPYGSSTISDSLAGLFLTRSDHNIAAHLWRQNKEVLNIVITPDGKIITQGYAVHANGQRQLLSGTAIPEINVGCFLSTLNSCLSGAGIAAWAIALIAVFCGVACAITIGAGCVVCLLAISAISGATMGACIAYAQKRCP